jgi:hypothetical protein
MNGNVANMASGIAQLCGCQQRDRVVASIFKVKFGVFVGQLKALDSTGQLLRSKADTKTALAFDLTQFIDLPR